MKYDVSYLKEDQQDSADSLLKEPKFLEKRLVVSEYTNATVLPFSNPDYKCLGGIVTSSGDFLQQSGLHEERHFGIYDYSEENVVFDNSTVLYLGYLLSVYGHLITDDIKKCWALFVKGIQYDKIIYIADWQEGSTPRHVQELFDIIGIDQSKCCCINTLTRYKKILLPDNSFIHHDGKKYFTKEYTETITYIKNLVINDNTLPKLGERIYFSRTKLKQSWRREVGESQIETVFRKQGFSIVYPENYSLREQISIVHNCNCFASTEGSIAHNSIWCQPETSVTLIRKVNCINVWQMVINESSNLNVTYVDAHNSIRTNQQFPLVGPFYMCITPEFERYIGRKRLILPLWLRPSWYIYKYQLQESRLYQKINRMFQKLSFFVESK